MNEEDIITLTTSHTWDDVITYSTDIGIFTPNTIWTDYPATHYGEEKDENAIASLKEEVKELKKRINSLTTIMLSFIGEEQMKKIIRENFDENGNSNTK